MVELFRTTPTYLRAACMCFAAIVLTSAYCLAYTHFSGDRSSVAEAIGWAVINVAPWVAAIEIGRHAKKWAGRFAVLAGALALSFALEWLLLSELAPAFELVRRIPGLALSLAALLALDQFARHRAPKSSTAQCAADLAGIEWIRGAGNYLELHPAAGRPHVVRATLSAALHAHAREFVRVHRSYLVRRASIARIDSASVLLRNGKRVPLGPRYRSTLQPA